jgi:hypothetical protein
MPDADMPGKWLAAQLCFKIDQLAFRAATVEPTMFDSGYACRIISAVFEALERVDQHGCNGVVADNSNDPAHVQPPD